MASDDEDVYASGGRRRRIQRKAALTFSGVDESSTREGVRDINQEAMDIARNPPPGAVPRPAVADSPPAPAIGGELPGSATSAAAQEDYSPQARLEQVRSRATDMEREYRLQLIHRMLLRNIPRDEIAAGLGISYRQLQRDIAELEGQLRAAADKLDINHLIGNSKGFYEEVQAMAMRAASNAQIPMPMRLAAMRTALASHNDMHRFFQAAGVYDTLRFRKANTGGQTDVGRLMALTTELIADLRAEGRSGGNPLGSFSGSDSETLDL